MRARPSQIAALGLLVGVAAAVACWAFWPRGYAVNAPLGYLLFGRGRDAPAPDEVRAWLAVPPGFAIALYAENLPNARWLRFTPRGDLLVSTPRSGRVMILERDEDGDGHPDAVRPLLENLDRPHGLDLHDGWLYVGETGAIARVRFDPEARRTEGSVERVATALPAGGNHFTRTVRFGPDGWMYVTVGSSCNACLEEDPHRAAMLRYRPDGSGEEIVARGLRNSVGFDWQPGTGALYATDNGRDLLGDDFPPCELNRIVPGGFYGWPFFNGRNVPDPDFGDTPGARAARATAIPPVHEFRAHNAPLGIVFLRGARWPAPWRGAALVALHGSWNRSQKDGYQVVSLHWQPDGRIEERPFATGFLRGDEVIGRPVDVTEGPDGAIYVSDDYAGAIYRIHLASDGGSVRGAAAPPHVPASAAGALAALPADERSAGTARGAALFARHECARCHDPQRADPGVVPVPLARLAGRYDLERLAAYLKAPDPPMPAFPLSDPERRDLAIYLLSTHAR